MKKAILLLLSIAMAISPAYSWTFTDDLGRTFEFDKPIERIAPSGSLAQMIIYSVAKDNLVGLSAAVSSSAEKYLDPAMNELAVFGTFYGRKANLNKEEVILSDPDAVIDMGEIKGDATSTKSDLDELTRSLNIPVIFIECYLDNTADAYRKLGRLLGKEDECNKRAEYAERALKTAEEKKEKISDPVSVYYSSSPDALVAVESGSFHGEVIEKIGAENVVPSSFSESSGTVSLEELIIWDPDVILLSDKNAYERVMSDRTWGTLRAVREGSVYLIPTSPYSFIDSPPSVNRIIGIYWLGSLLYPDLYSDIDLEAELKEFYSLFYCYDLSESEAESLAMR